MDANSGDLLQSIYAELSAPLIRTDIETAELVKYTDNVWHALKVGFANEIGNIAKQLGIDGHKVMDIFCQDTKLNLSPYYMKPGFSRPAPTICAKARWSSWWSGSSARATNFASTTVT
jgi:GDP-mannose 6-dehydrogenase